jgi:hypothetical protein
MTFRKRNIGRTHSNAQVNGAVAQAVSRWFSNTAVLLLTRVRLHGICGGQNRITAGFLRVLSFPLPIVPPTAPHSLSSIILGWYNMPNGCRRTYTSGLSPITAQEIKIN